MRHDIKMIRRAEREWKKVNDPFFGKRRKTAMEGNRKAQASKSACRKGNW